MSEAPERIALRWELGAAVTSGPLMTHPDYTQYVRADLAQAPAPVRVGCPYGASGDDCCGGFCNMQRADDEPVQKMHKSADLEAPNAGVVAELVEAALDAAHAYLVEQYGSSPLAHPVDRSRVLAKWDAK